MRRPYGLKTALIIQLTGFKIKYFFIKSTGITSMFGDNRIMKINIVNIKLWYWTNLNWVFEDILLPQIKNPSNGAIGSKFNNAKLML